MKWYREFIVQAPEEINGFFAFMTVPPGPPFPGALHLETDVRDRLVLSGLAWSRPTQILEPIRSFRPPGVRVLRTHAVPMLQSMFDPTLPDRVCSGTGRPISSRISPMKPSRSMSNTARSLPTWQSTMHLYPVNGAAHTRRSKRETAWSYRDAVWSEVIVGVDPDPANAVRSPAGPEDYYDALHPFGAGGAYVNFMMEEGDERIRATYRGNYDRLTAIKTKYDPENFFRVNQNIRPAS